MSISLTQLFTVVQNILSVTKKLVIFDLIFSVNDFFELDLYNFKKIKMKDMN